MVDDIYPLYLNVFARSPLQFEKLTKEFLATAAELARLLIEQAQALGEPPEDPLDAPLPSLCHGRRGYPLRSRGDARPQDTWRLDASRRRARFGWKQFCCKACLDSYLSDIMRQAHRSRHWLDFLARKE